MFSFSFGRVTLLKLIGGYWGKFRDERTQKMWLLIIGFFNCRNCLNDWMTTRDFCNVTQKCSDFCLSISSIFFQRLSFRLFLRRAHTEAIIIVKISFNFKLFFCLTKNNTQMIYGQQCVSVKTNFCAATAA
jgi:hypothetical protein